MVGMLWANLSYRIGSCGIVNSQALREGWLVAASARSVNYQGQCRGACLSHCTSMNYTIVA